MSEQLYLLGPLNGSEDAWRDYCEARTAIVLARAFVYADDGRSRDEVERSLDSSVYTLVELKRIFGDG